MASIKRKIIFEMFDGRCAYCGCELKNGWHVDHIEPVMRTSKMKEGYYRHKITKQKISRSELPDRWYKEYEYVSPKMVFDKMMRPENDTVENSMPSCASCNLYKAGMDLETFRRNVGELVRRLNENFTQYKIVKRYGQITETETPIVFYFETKRTNLKK